METSDERRNVAKALRGSFLDPTGELVSITKEVPCGCGEAPYIPYYCPNCGARVVNCHE